MSRRAALGLLLISFVALDARGQIPFSRDLVPAQGITLNGEALTPLARVGLERNWYAVVPLSGTERVLTISLAENLVFAQTTESNLHAYDADSGRHLWVANIGGTGAQAFPVSVNSTTVFASGLHYLFALERSTGKTLWSLKLEAMPSSGTAADETRVSVGLSSGKLATFDLKTMHPAFFWQTGREITAQPILAGPVVAFASQDARVYVALIDPPTLIYRFLTAGPISASLGTHDTRMLIVPSQDNSVYAIDLFTGDTRWRYPTGSPVAQQPLVGGDDVYILNTSGVLSAIDARNGDVQWEVTTGGGRLLSAGEKRVYLESPFRDLYIVDRKTGSVVADARSVRERAGLNLREFTITPTNPLTGRIYLGAPSGMVMCLRELGRTKPYMLRDPKAPPFGYIPRTAETTPGAPAEAAPPAEPGAAKPAEGEQGKPPEGDQAKPPEGGTVPAPGGQEKPAEPAQPPK